MFFDFVAIKGIPNKAEKPTTNNQILKSLTSIKVILTCNETHKNTNKKQFTTLPKVTSIIFFF